MPTLDPHEHPLTTLLAPVFAALEEEGEVDLVELPAINGFEIQADDWTMHLVGWPIATGFIALDEEPSSQEERKMALDAAVNQRHLAALRQANILLNGAIVDVLDVSGDSLSRMLAATLAVESDSTDDDPAEA